MSTIFAAMLLLQAPQGHPIEPGFPGTAVGHRPKVEIPWNRF